MSAALREKTEGLILSKRSDDPHIRSLMNLYIEQPLVLEVFQRIRKGSPDLLGTFRSSSLYELQAQVMVKHLEDAGAIKADGASPNGYRAVVDWIRLDEETPLKAVARSSTKACALIEEITDNSDLENSLFAVISHTATLCDQRAFKKELMQLLSKYLTQKEMSGPDAATFRLAISGIIDRPQP